MSKSISYAITTHNETDVLGELINTLQAYIKEEDEMVILDDHSDNPQTCNILKNLPNVHKSKFTGNYADHKNNLNNKCKKDYIFQLDGDEVPTELLLYNIKEIINSNDVDLIYLPRENIINGIEDFHLKKWKWSKDDKDRINYPDFQGRVYRNTEQIKWERPLHEYITGHVTWAKIPPNSGLDLIHIKDIEVQVQSNNRYDNDYDRNDNFSYRQSVTKQKDEDGK